MHQPHQPDQPTDTWADGAAYEAYIGRWSRLVAKAFLPWLTIESEQRWLDVGSGSGALVQAVLDQAQPREVKGVDRSSSFVYLLRETIDDSRVSFDVADAQALPFESGRYEVAVSGLVLNFVEDPAAAVREMVRVTRSGGTVAAYVWDYAGQMQLIRYFWDAAVTLDPAVRARNQAERFPICRPDALQTLFEDAGLRDVAVQAIEIEMTFRDFDEYWTPFLGGQGPAPSYVMSLGAHARAILRERIRASLPFAVDGSISLPARAWAVRGHH